MDVHKHTDACTHTHTHAHTLSSTLYNMMKGHQTPSFLISFPLPHSRVKKKLKRTLPIQVPVYEVLSQLQNLAMGMAIAIMHRK